MKAKKDIAVITGPTSVGKSSIAIKLAQNIGGEIISADSIQVYKYMDIGSAKIKYSDMKGIKHHLIDTAEPTEDYSVSVFRDAARECIADIRNRGRFPIVCGGTGFYIQALVKDIDFSESETDPDIREKFSIMFDRCGMEYMERLLHDIDPVSSVKYHGNRKRIIRALEYHELTGEKLSDKNEKEKNRKPVYDTACFVLTMPRDLLYARIDDRVDLMMEEGLVEEVIHLREMGVKREMTSMQGLGYRQIYDYLEGKCSMEDAVYEIKLQTRHFAKRQLTWFRREKDVIWIDITMYDNMDSITEYMAEIINGKI